MSSARLRLPGRLAGLPLPDPCAALVCITILGVATVPLHPFWLLAYVGWMVAGAVLLAASPALRQALFAVPERRRMVALFAFLALWQAAGIVARGEAAEARIWQATANIVTVFLFLITVFGALRRDAGFARWLLPAASIFVAIGAGWAMVQQIWVQAEYWHMFPRLYLYGRAGNPIQAATVLAFASAAGLLALRTTRGGLRLAVLVSLALNLAGLYLTYGRGPLIAFIVSGAITLVLAWMKPGRLRAAAAAVMILLAVALPTSLVLAEPVLNQLGCAQVSNAGVIGGGNEMCRTSYRLEIWHLAIRSIAAHPLFGAGPEARIDHPLGEHPHNGYLSMAFYFGLPALAAYLGLIVNAIAAALTRPAQPARRLALWMLIFTLMFMAADLANPISFINAYYLYLWLPMALALGYMPGHEDGAAAKAPV